MYEFDYSIYETADEIIESLDEKKFLNQNNKGGLVPYLSMEDMLSKQITSVYIPQSSIIINSEDSPYLMK